MIRIELPSLIQKLNPIAKLALEQAASLCITRKNREVGVNHFLLCLLDVPKSDLRVLIDQLGFSADDVKEKLTAALPRDQSGESYPVFSPLLIEMLQEAWLLSSAELNQTELRSGAIFLATLLQGERYFSFELLTFFKKVNREALRSNFDALLVDSVESPVVNAEGNDKLALMNAANTNLAKYTTNITEQAREDKLDPVLSRDKEIDLMIDILCRRRKNNPIVVGDPGVGKSAVIEGLAQRIVDKRVPERLQSVEVLSLDLGLLQAGASVKGEFEKRFKGIIDEVKNSPKPIILFIDEAHTLIGAGNQEGGGDAANLLKPALARGELRTVAATTWKEYRKYFEKDPALTRRFQLVKLGEPTVEQAVHIMRGLHSVYEKSHSVMITDAALTAAAELSARYVSGRQLPDKAIDVLDTACARISINLTAPPSELSALENKLHEIAREQNLIERQQKIGAVVDIARLETLKSQVLTLEADRESITAEWTRQKTLVHEIIETRSLLLEKILDQPAELINSEISALHHDTPPNDAGEFARTDLPEAEHEEIDLLKQKLESLELQFSEIKEKDLLVHSLVDRMQIAAVIADWTGVPVNQMNTDELEKITNLPHYLGNAIKGQDVAIRKVHKHMLTARADLRRSGRPKGAFLLVGPSGVGKTETVVQIAEQLYGGKQFLTVINMSEYQEKHTVSRLLGAPPGYVGYGEGGVLTEAIRQKPYSIVLLDEVEKAHPEVLNIFYQAFDKGELADGEGRLIDCQNILFFLTSNLGFQTIVDYASTPNLLEEKLYPELAAFFKPALLARMEIVPYFPLADDTLDEIVRYKLKSLEKTLATRYHATVNIDDSLIHEIRRRATRSENGARMLESIIDGQLLPPLSLIILNKMAHREKIHEINLLVEDNEFVCNVI